MSVVFGTLGIIVVSVVAIIYTSYRIIKGVLHIGKNTGKRIKVRLTR